VTFETNDNYSIRFESSNNSSTIRFDSKWKKNTIRTALFVAIGSRVNRYGTEMKQVGGKMLDIIE